MADNRISLFRFQKLLGSKVPMLETIEEETEAEKTMDFGSETKKVGDENRKEDQKMLNITSTGNNVVGLEAVENSPREMESDKKEVVDNKSKETLAINMGKGGNQDNDDKGESTSSPNEMKKPESQVSKDVVCSQGDIGQKQGCGTSNLEDEVSFPEDNIEMDRMEWIEDNTMGANLWEKIKMAFSWNDFFYSIIFGLLPTSWDVLSDLRFGWSLSKSGDTSSAGLCYLFIMIPGIWFLQDLLHQCVLNKGCSSRVNTMLYIVYGVASITALAFGFWVEPLLFQYPATAIGFAVIGVKVVGVFVHTPEMKAFSVRISAFEYTTESNLQLCLLFYIWTVLTLQAFSIYGF